MQNAEYAAINDEFDNMQSSGCPLSCFNDLSVAKVKVENRRPVAYTDVVIIGNGPSALALSAFLSGYHPYYNVNKPHPDLILHKKLLHNDKKSLLEMDFFELSEGLEGRSNHPVSLLYDSLVRPNADLGEEHASSLLFRSRPERLVKHVVIGKGSAGGSWVDFSPDTETLSFASWLDLPAYSFRNWLEKEGANFATGLEMTIDTSAEIVGRVPCAAVQRYFKDYVTHLNLQKHFTEFAYVTCVYRTEEDDEGYSWNVRGCQSFGSFHFRSKRLVLASGVCIPKHLPLVADSEKCPHVLHSLSEMENLLPKLIASSSMMEPVLVVGDGLSAADAIVKLLVSGFPVVHSFRKTPRDPKNVLSKLSSALYPEYHTVYRLMTGEIVDKLYVVHQRTEVASIVDNGSQRYAILRRVTKNRRRNADDETTVQVVFSYVVVLIGFQADLSYFADNGRHMAVNACKAVDSKSNVIDVSPFDYRCRKEAKSYAVGPLVGDNFVRFIIGGSLAAASSICSELLSSYDES